MARGWDKETRASEIHAEIFLCHPLRKRFRAVPWREHDMNDIGMHPTATQRTTRQMNGQVFPF